MTTRQHAIELFLTFETQCNTCFEALLYRLIAKADFENRWRLSSGLKEEVAAYLEWSQARTAKEFYDSYLTDDEQRDLKKGKKVWA